MGCENVEIEKEKQGKYLFLTKIRVQEMKK